VRTFIYDGTEHPDPNTDFSPEQVKQMMANFFPELHNAEIKEIKRPNGDIAYEFLRRTGTKGSWKAQIKTAEDKDWVDNLIRLPTKAEADMYAFDLAMRWTAVLNWQTVESQDPANYRLENGQLVGIPEPALKN
jgi:PRTRC genetic system protein C